MKYLYTIASQKFQTRHRQDKQKQKNKHTILHDQRINSTQAVIDANINN